MAAVVKVDIKTITEVDRLLVEAYGDRKWKRRAEPIDELIMTMLSQRTNDLNRDKAFERLKEKFPSWEQILKAKVSSIESAIKPAGLSKQKAPRIKAILQRIAEANGGNLSLDFLSRMPVPKALSWLKSLPGVGPKTAACVLLFSFGKPVFPVDTHIFRISKRLGWLDSNVTEAEANELLDKVIPDAIKYRLHLNMIAHGRRICRPKNPRCQECVLKSFCGYFQQRKW